MRKSRCKIAVIGAGKLAWSFIPALQEAGYNVGFILSRRISEAEKTARRFGIAGYSDSLQEIPAGCSVIFLAVPDDQLKSLSNRICKIHSNLDDKIFVHFSGVYSSEIIKDIEKAGGLTASFHFMQTFPSKRKIIVKNSFASIEAQDQKAGNLLFKIAGDLGINAFPGDPGTKPAYHLSGVFASNFLVGNFYNAEKLFRSTGSDLSFYRFIEPIVKNTLRNIKKSGTANSLSGPVDRGDFNTVKMHVKYLKRFDKLLHSYFAQSLNLLQIKKEQGKMLPVHAEIEKYLKKELKKITL